MDKWFDPAFQEFVDKELIPMGKKYVAKLNNHCIQDVRVRWKPFGSLH
jgi:hypothetical protein